MFVVSPGSAKWGHLHAGSVLLHGVCLPCIGSEVSLHVCAFSPAAFPHSAAGVLRGLPVKREWKREGEREWIVETSLPLDDGIIPLCLFHLQMHGPFLSAGKWHPFKAFYERPALRIISPPSKWRGRAVRVHLDGAITLPAPVNRHKRKGVDSRPPPAGKKGQRRGKRPKVHRGAKEPWKLRKRGQVVRGPRRGQGQIAYPRQIFTTRKGKRTKYLTLEGGPIVGAVYPRIPSKLKRERAEARFIHNCDVGQRGECKCETFIDSTSVVLVRVGKCHRRWKF